MTNRIRSSSTGTAALASAAELLPGYERPRGRAPRPVPWALLLMAMVVVAGCARRPPSRPVGATGFQGQGPEVQRLYQGMGLIAAGGAIPFVGSVSFLRSPAPDSTLVLVALSMPAQSLAFVRDGDRYSAVYNARLELRQDGGAVRVVDAKETVRVPTFRETSRTDESVIWQQFLNVRPGNYVLQVGIRDESGIRSSTEEVNIEVPRFPATALSTPIPVYEAIPRASVDSLPRILARPRSSVLFGQDSILPVYIEATGSTPPERVDVVVTGENNVTLWRTTADLQGRGTLRHGTLELPVSRLGVGVVTLRLSAAGAADTTRARVLVSLGDDLPIASFDEMVTYLRWFATSERLRALREAAPEDRADAWTTFLRATDPFPGTPENEGVRDYFVRIRQANQRFRDDAPIGWQSDRGTAFVALGDPDEVYDSNANDPTARVRQQVWVYREQRLQLVFLDQSGFGRWRLSPAGMSDLQNAIRRKLSLQQS
jgi:GWxTD domain-containing protein